MTTAPAHVTDSPGPWRPLEGLRVLELQSGPVAAYAGKLFREYGAEVVLLEDPGMRSEIRSEGPFAPGAAGINDGGLHRYLNAGKLGVSLRDGHPDGRALVRRLALAADLFVHELTAESAASRGLAFAGLHEESAALVVLAITPFGGSGPYAGWKATENVLFAMSGRMHLHGQAGRAPLGYAPMIVSSQIAATAAGAAIAALFEASAGGAGREVEVSGLEAQLASVDTLFLLWTMAGYETPRGFYPPYTYPCADGSVLLGAVGLKYLTGIAQFLGLPGLPADPRFNTPQALAQHQEEFDEIVIPHFLSKTRDEIVASLQGFGTLCAPIIPLEEVPSNPQYRERGFFRPLDTEHPDTAVPGPSFRLDAGVSPPVLPPAPARGQDTAAVLVRWLDCDGSEISELAGLGVFG